jgi:hypothetical protein
VAPTPTGGGSATTTTAVPLPEPTVGCYGGGPFPEIPDLYYNGPINTVDNVTGYTAFSGCTDSPDPLTAVYGPDQASAEAVCDTLIGNGAIVSLLGAPWLPFGSGFYLCLPLF